MMGFGEGGGFTIHDVMVLEMCSRIGSYFLPAPSRYISCKLLFLNPQIIHDQTLPPREREKKGGRAERKEEGRES